MGRKQYFWNLLVCICFCIAFISCESTEEDPTPGGNNNPPDNKPSSSIEGCQYPASEMLATTNPAIDNGSFKSTTGNPNVYQVFGYSFTVAFEGSVKELGIKVPETGTYTVRIYRKDPVDTQILAEAEIDATDDQWTYTAIDPLDLDPDDEYMTAIYFKTKAEGLETFFYSIAQFQYPQTYGDVTLVGYAVNSEIGEKVKPLAQDSDDPTLFNGFVDLCFEAD